MHYTYNALWSTLKIISSQDIDRKYLLECEEKITSFEKKYSRFITGNYLYNLNLSWTSHIDDEFKTLFGLCQKVYVESHGYFDITILPTLEKLWYGKTYNIEKNILWMNHIQIEWDTIMLNNVCIEFWAIWKWYIIDWIYSHLSQYCKDIVVDFGWDIRVWNIEKIIWLEDPFDSTKIIWTVSLCNNSLWASAWNKRYFHWSHHLINALSWDSQKDKIAVFTKHKLATLADTYSTALFVSPLEVSLEILKKTPWLDALIIASDGTIYETENFNAHLNK